MPLAPSAGPRADEVLIHRVLEPFELLRALRWMIAPAGTLVIGSVLLADPERSEYLRFVLAGHSRDKTSRLIPGRLAFRLDAPDRRV